MAQLKTKPNVKAAKPAKPSAGGKVSKGKAAPANKTSVKKAPVKKAPAKKAPAKKAPAKKAPAKKAPAKKAPAKKAPAKKAPAKKAPVKKVPAKQAPAKKAPVKKAPVKKAPVKQAPVKKAPTKPVAATVAPPAKKEAIAPRPPKVALKERYLLEFYLNASVASLYEHISTPSGFSKWFCDDVNVVDNMYTFQWGQDTEMAECLNQRPSEYIRFRWADDIDEDPNAYFELRIRIDGMTNETCLVVTDHAWPRDMEEEKALWESQINTLTRVLGA
ncbi:MAG: START-like domain-containing protein [Flavobacteriales bacterium]